MAGTSSSTGLGSCGVVLVVVVVMAVEQGRYTLHGIQGEMIVLCG
jgi:hypothetical protein